MNDYGSDNLLPKKKYGWIIIWVLFFILVAVKAAVSWERYHDKGFMGLKNKEEKRFKVRIKGV